MTDMTNAARKAQREYMRAWRKKNPERVREKNRRYWEKRAQRMQEGGMDDAKERV